MTEYTASNGAQVVLTNAGQTGYILVERESEGSPYVSTAYLGFEEMVAWREFEQHRRDEELGRWRYPANPDYVVYPPDADDEDQALRILFEPGGGSADTYTREWLASVVDPDAWEPAACAKAYFESHPEPKPWMDARAGEVWELTFSEAGGGGPEAWIVHKGMTFQNPEYVSKVSLNDSTIVSGRRIWPEEGAS